MTKVARTFFVENLGCPKNAVEGEGMAERLLQVGYTVAPASGEADVVIVNTCSFIQPAQEESIERIFHYVNRRRPGQQVIAAGCLAERYGAALQQDIPELDGILGTRRWYEIDKLVQEVERGGRPCWHGAEPADDPSFRRRGGKPTAYVKIAEGCNMSCTFCAIPSFKGPQRSKAPAEVVQEIRELVAGGVREVILVSQNTTAYGQDFARSASRAGSDRSRQGSGNGAADSDAAAPSLPGVTLARLLEQICAEVPELPWLRFHYCYPGWVTDDLLCTMARLDQVVKYVDIPLQHAHPEMLRTMNRPSNIEQVKAVLTRAREVMPDVALRTTFIVGFPGETSTHFNALLQFMEQARFDHVGIFPYFPEEGTPAAELPRQVPEPVKQRRQRRAMELQQRISLERNQAFVGRDVQVLVEGMADGAAGDGQLAGRTFRDAPEVDGYVLFRGQARPGDLVQVKINGAGPYDLFGAQLSNQAGEETRAQPPSEVARRALGEAKGVGLRSLPLLQPR